MSKGNVWYLVARRTEAFRTYRLDRFHTVTQTDNRFQRVDGFDLATYWQETTAQLDIPYFACVLKILVDRLQFLKWMASGRFKVLQELASNEQVTIDLRVRSLDVARMLVLGIGAGTVVIGPSELRQAVRESITPMHLQYNDG